MSELITRPSWLSTNVDSGIEELNNFIIPPRLKVVQPTSKVPEGIMPGDVLLMPQGLKVIGLSINEKGFVGRTSDKVIFTPLFFFPEWVAWNPLEVKGQEPAVIASSYDRGSDIAMRARDPKMRKQPHPTAKRNDGSAAQISYVEHLNFIVLLHSEGFNVIPALMSFSRSEHRHGTNFAALIKMRQAPLYACKFAFNVGYRENDKGRWYGLDITNPTEEQGPWVSEEMFHVTQRHYEELKKAHEANSIRVDHDFDDSDTLDGQVVHNPEL